MYNWCRYALAATLTLTALAGVVVAGDQAEGGLESRLRALDARFGMRRQHSDAVLNARSQSASAHAAAGDIVVNNDGFGGFSNQTDLVVARQQNGGTVVLWTDDRDANLSVYGQVLDSLGIPLGPNFRLHSDPNNFDQFDPAILVRSDGGFYAAFTEQSSAADASVVVQRFSRLGQALGSAVFVADDSLPPMIQRKPVLAALSNGDVIVIYEEDDADAPNSNIFGRRLLADVLTPTGPKFEVAADLTVGGTAVLYDEREPAVSVGPNDVVWVVWTDDRDGGARDVFAQRMMEGAVDTLGQTIFKLGSASKVNDEPVSANAIQMTPRLAVSSNNRMLVVWSDFRNAKWDVYKQSFDDAGARSSNNALVNFTDISNQDHVAPQISWSDSLGVVVWKDFRNGVGQTFAQRYDAMGEGIMVNFFVGEPGTGNQSTPSSSMMSDGSFAVGWTQPESGLSSAYYRPVSLADVPGASQTVAVTVISAKQVKPICAMGPAGDVITMWEESRAALPNIVGQALDNTLGKPQGDLQVNNGPPVFHFLPAAAVGGTTGFAVWEDYRDTLQPVYSDIYIQRFTLDATGYTAVGSNVRVIDTVESQEVRLASWNPDAAADATGRCMVVWQDNRFGSWDIFAALYSDSTDPGSGDPVRIGRNFRVDQGPDLTKQEEPRVDMNGAGQAVVIWQDTRNDPNDFDVRARMYSGGGQNSLGSEVLLSLDSTHIPRQADVAVWIDGSFAVVYEEHTDPDNVEIYIQRFGATGAPAVGALGDPILVNDDGMSMLQFSPRVAATSMGYVVVWQDERAGDWDIYASLVPFAATVANVNYIVNDAEATDQTVPTIAGLRTSPNPYVCWEDLRLTNTAPDIFGNRNAPSIAAGIEDDWIEDPGLTPREFSLGQNYPNPFNPATEIRFALESPVHVELIVFNMLGQKVRTLLDAPRTAGTHRVTWDGLNDIGVRVATGTYLYRLRWPEGEISRKMTLLK